MVTGCIIYDLILVQCQEHPKKIRAIIINKDLEEGQHTPRGKDWCEQTLTKLGCLE